MNLLFISTSIPPYPDMQAIRNYYLIDGLVRAGHHVTIVTSEFPWGKDPVLTSQLEKICRIVRTIPPLLIRLWRGSLSRNAAIKRILGVLLNKIARPDMHMGWDKKVQTLIGQSLLTEESFDIVITSSGSYTAHLAGKRIAEKHKLKWILEYGDPWGLDKYGNAYQKLVKEERELLRLSSGLVMTTQETIDAYSNTFHLEWQPHLAPCGYDRVIRDQKDEIGIDVLYTGVAFAGDRNLMPAMESVSEFREELRFRIVGDYSNKYLEKLTEPMRDRLTFEGRVPFEKSVEYLSKTRLIVIIGNLGALQVPGKTYISLATQKPILYIRQEKGHDPTLHVLQQFPGIFYAENNPSSITQALHQVFDDYENAKSAAEQRVELPELARYTWKNISDQFANYVTMVGEAGQTE